MNLKLASPSVVIAAAARRTGPNCKLPANVSHIHFEGAAVQGAKPRRADLNAFAQTQHDQSMRQPAHFEHDFPRVIIKEFAAGEVGIAHVRGPRHGAAVSMARELMGGMAWGIEQKWCS